MRLPPAPRGGGGWIVDSVNYFRGGPVALKRVPRLHAPRRAVQRDGAARARPPHGRRARACSLPRNAVVIRERLA